MSHASAELIAGYAAGAELPGDRVWALEAHLESCAQCRARLAEHQSPAVSALVEGVWAGLGPALDAAAPARKPRARWLVTWVTPVMVPWVVMVLLVPVIALMFDVVARGVSLIALLAPVLPVLGVAASWSRGLDPAHEMVTATPRAGLFLVLRRTTAVLVVVLPVLLVAGWVTGEGFGLWLLPSLAFTTGTLALGSVVGMNRAAAVLVAVWLAVLVLPTIAHVGQTLALRPVFAPVWAGIFVLTAALTVLRRGSFSRLGTFN